MNPRLASVIVLGIAVVLFFIAYIIQTRRESKRKQIKKSEPVRCWLDTANDPSEISLDENVTRTPMHPADQFERFRELSDGKGWGAAGMPLDFGTFDGMAMLSGWVPTVAVVRCSWWSACWPSAVKASTLR